MSRNAFVDFKAVKASVSMLQILDHYSLTDRFKRSGESLSGPCPLHGGENPSHFRVSLVKNCWNCFGKCKSGGNILDFVARMEGSSLREAAIAISGWVSLPGGSAPESGDERPEAGRRPAAKAERESESASQEPGPNKPLGFELRNLDSAHPYLAERGFTPETIAEFGLGYCGKGSMAGRIVIPIHNADGRLVAYAGRWPGEPPDEETPKYKLPGGFRKAQEVYNFHRAILEPQTSPLVVTEGFFDCAWLWQHGVRRVVGVMGSSLSSAQEELILRITAPESRVLLLLDEDGAGRAGRAEILERLAPFRFVKAFRFREEGQRPDDLAAEELNSLCS